MQLSKYGMDFGQGGAGGSSFVVAKMEARVGGGSAFVDLLPESLEAGGRNRGGLGWDFWGPAESRDKLSVVIIYFWGADKSIFQDGVGS